jgi:hypothetical protein
MARGLYTYRGMYGRFMALASFVMWQCFVSSMGVVALGLSGGIVALFVRGMHTEASTVLGFGFVCVLAIVQVWDGCLWYR